MITVIDYGMGNVWSVANAFEAVGCKVCISNKKEDIQEADKLVLPGVGAFANAMKKLRDLDLIVTLDEEVIEEEKPILGICLGMQLFCQKSYEDGEHDGLGWINAVVKRLTPKDKSLQIPHVGWNDIQFKKDDPLFSGMIEQPNFYFVHSYFVDCDDNLITSEFDYGGLFTASIHYKNIFGAQFHPEKSQKCGLDLLENFATYGVD